MPVGGYPILTTFATGSSTRTAFTHVCRGTKCAELLQSRDFVYCCIGLSAKFLGLKVWLGWREANSANMSKLMCGIEYERLPITCRICSNRGSGCTELAYVRFHLTALAESCSSKFRGVHLCKF